jgi:hypothetical protein
MGYNLTSLPNLSIMFSNFFHSTLYATWITPSLNVCAHIPSTLFVSIFYIVFIAMNALKAMMQFVTPLPPLHEMLASMWDNNNCMHFF